LNIFYERQIRTNAISQWIVNHPRISFPIIGAIAAGFTYIIFDPVRKFFMTSKITQRFNPEEYAIYRWLRKEAWARIVPSKARDGALDATPEGWSEREEEYKKLKTLLRGVPETFILVTGPKGSGKSTLVRAATTDKKYKVKINGEQLANSRNNNEMISNLAKQLGYFPVFTWLVSFSGLIDTLVSITTGQKAGLSPSTDTQFKKILETVAIVLQQISVTDGPSYSKESLPALQRLQQLVGSSQQATDANDDIVSRSIEHSDEIPIVIIDGFLSREKGSHQQEMWENIVEWATLLVENRVAHVIFVTQHVGAVKILGKALPDRTFETISLSDAQPESAMRFVQKRLDAVRKDRNLTGLDRAIAALGGRLTDLQLFIEKIYGGLDSDGEYSLFDIKQVAHKIAVYILNTFDSRPK